MSRQENDRNVSAKKTASQRTQTQNFSYLFSRDCNSHNMTA